MHSKPRPSCSPSPNSRRRRATLAVQVCPSVPTSAPQPAVHATARPGCWPGLASGSDGACPASWTSSTVSCPRRDLLGATALPAVGLTSPEPRWRCPVGFPALRVTELSCRTSDPGPGSARAARRSPGAGQQPCWPADLGRLIVDAERDGRVLGESPRSCHAFARRGPEARTERGRTLKVLGHGRTTGEAPSTLRPAGTDARRPALLFVESPGESGLRAPGAAPPAASEKTGHTPVSGFLTSVWLLDRSATTNS